MEMKTFEAEASDGTPVRFTAPANATPEQLQQLAAEAYRNLKARKAEKPAEQARPPEEVAEPPAPPASSPIAEAAKKALGEASSQTGMTQEGIAGGALGALAGLAETRRMGGFGPASILEKAAAGAQRGMGPPTPMMPPAGPVGGPAGPAGGPVAPVSAPVGPLSAPAGGVPLGPQMGGSGTFNYGKAFGLTDIEAARALDMTKQAGGVHDLSTQRREGLQRIQQLFPGERYIENPRFGGIMTPEQGVGAGPRAQFVQTPAGPGAPTGAPASLQQLPPRQPIPTTPRPPSGLDQVTQMFKEMAQTGARGARALGGVARALPVVSYPLAGYSMGEDLGAIQQELSRQQPDYADIALRGAGALGTGLSLHPVTAPVGIPLALAAPAIAAARRKIMAQPKVPEVTFDEFVQASKPAFRYSRP